MFVDAEVPSPPPTVVCSVQYPRVMYDSVFQSEGEGKGEEEGDGEAEKE